LVFGVFGSGLAGFDFGFWAFDFGVAAASRAAALSLTFMENLLSMMIALKSAVNIWNVQTCTAR
jgi:hypothetical protein